MENRKRLIMNQLFVELGLNEKDIIWESKNGESPGNDIYTADDLDSVIKRLYNRKELNNKIIIFKINTNMKEEGEKNSQDAALYFYKDNVYYIDYTKKEIPEEVKTSKELFKYSKIKDSMLILEKERRIQISNKFIKENQGNLEILLPIIVYLIKYEEKDINLITLNKRLSDNIFDVLGSVYNTLKEDQNQDQERKSYYLDCDILKINDTEEINQETSLFSQSESKKINKIDEETNKFYELIQNFDVCFTILHSIKEILRQKTMNHNLLKRNKMTQEDYESINFELNNKQNILYEQYKNICQKYNIDHIDKKFNSNSITHLIYSILTNFYKSPVFKNLMSYEITSKLDNAIKVFRKDYAFRDEIIKISLTVQINNFKNETHEQRIMKCLKRDFGFSPSQIIIKPVGMGKNNSFFVITPDGNKYIKPCGYGLVGLNTNDGKIHPNELFLYRILEYLELGPKANFLLQDNASGSLYINSPSVIAHGNYIMTDEVPNLLLDTDENAQSSINIQDYDQFINTNLKSEAIELSIASLIKDLLSLSDVYPNNGQNYGIYKKNENGEYKFAFIDHIPGSNGIFGYEVSEDRIHEYSPRTQMESFNKEKSYGNLRDFSKNHNLWNKFSLTKDVNEKFFNEDSLINKAIIKAENDIIKLIDHYPNNFASFLTIDGKDINSQVALRCYVNKIKFNIENYYKTDYAKKYFLEK